MIFHRAAKEALKGGVGNERQIDLYRHALLWFVDEAEFRALADSGYSRGEYPFKVGDTFVIATQLYQVAESEASDAHIESAAGVKIYEIGKTFSTLDRFKAAIARGVTYDAGAVVYADGLGYRFDDDGNTDIAGLTGWVRVTPDASDYAVPDLRYDYVTDLIASAEVSRGANALWEAQGFRYREWGAPMDADAWDIETAGGVRLAYEGSVANILAFGAYGDGTNSDSPAAKKAIAWMKRFSNYNDALDYDEIGAGLFLPYTMGGYVFDEDNVFDQKYVGIFTDGRLTRVQLKNGARFLYSTARLSEESLRFEVGSFKIEIVTDPNGLPRGPAIAASTDVLAGETTYDPFTGLIWENNTAGTLNTGTDLSNDALKAIGFEVKRIQVKNLRYWYRPVIHAPRANRVTVRDTCEVLGNDWGYCGFALGVGPLFGDFDLTDPANGGTAYNVDIYNLQVKGFFQDGIVGGERDTNVVRLPRTISNAQQFPLILRNVKNVVAECCNFDNCTGQGILILSDSDPGELSPYSQSSRAIRFSDCYFNGFLQDPTWIAPNALAGDVAPMGYVRDADEDAIWVNCTNETITITTETTSAQLATLNLTPYYPFAVRFGYAPGLEGWWHGAPELTPIPEGRYVQESVGLTVEHRAHVADDDSAASDPVSVTGGFVDASDAFRVDLLQNRTGASITLTSDDVDGIPAQDYTVASDGLVVVAGDKVKASDATTIFKYTGGSPITLGSTDITEAGLTALADMTDEGQVASRLHRSSQTSLMAFKWGDNNHGAMQNGYGVLAIRVSSGAEIGLNSISCGRSENNLGRMYQIVGTPGNDVRFFGNTDIDSISIIKEIDWHSTRDTMPYGVWVTGRDWSDDVVISDADVGGNDGSATVAATWSGEGKVAVLELSLSSFDTTGMTSGNPLWVKGLPVRPYALTREPVHAVDCGVLGVSFAVVDAGSGRMSFVKSNGSLLTIGDLGVSASLDVSFRVKSE